MIEIRKTNKDAIQCLIKVGEKPYRCLLNKDQQIEFKGKMVYKINLMAFESDADWESAYPGKLLNKNIYKYEDYY